MEIGDLVYRRERHERRTLPDGPSRSKVVKSRFGHWVVIPTWQCDFVGVPATRAYIGVEPHRNIRSIPREHWVLER